MAGLAACELLGWPRLPAIAILAACGLLCTNLAHAGQRIVIVGDSTASSYPAARFPRTGWGQVVDDFVSADVVRKNGHASIRIFLQVSGHFSD